MSLQLFGQPFSSYTWKMLIAPWADETSFDFGMLKPDHPENGDELLGRSRRRVAAADRPQYRFHGVRGRQDRGTH